MSAKRGHYAIVELLLSHGADAEVTGLAYGTTALIAAAQQGHLSIVQALLRHSADPAKPLHDGTTALDKANQYGHAEVAAALVGAMGERGVGAGAEGNHAAVAETMARLSLRADSM